MNIQTFFSLPYYEDMYAINNGLVGFSAKEFDKTFVYSDAFLSSKVRIVKYLGNSFVHINFIYNMKGIPAVQKSYFGKYNKIKDKILITNFSNEIILNQ